MADAPAPVVQDAPPVVVPEEVVPVAEELFYYPLESCDGKVVKISTEAIKQSKTLNDLIQNLEYTKEQAESIDPIPVENINEITLRKVVDWCEKHRGEEIPVDDESVPTNVTIPEWDENYLKIESDDLFNLIMAVNYLDIKQLMNYSCKKVALMAKGKSPEELRVIYGIPTDEEDAAEEKAKKEKEEAEKTAAEGEGGNAETAKESTDGDGEGTSAGTSAGTSGTSQ